MGPHASPLRAHPPSIPRPGTLSQPQPSRRAAAAQARTAAGPKAQGVGGGRGGAAAAEAAAAPEALAKRLRRPRAESALSARRCARPEGQQLDLVLPHPQQWKAASPGGAQRCTRRRPAAGRPSVRTPCPRSFILGRSENSTAAGRRWRGGWGRRRWRRQLDAATLSLSPSRRPMPPAALKQRAPAAEP